MRFAMACLDRQRYVFKTLIDAGWQPVKYFSTPQNNGLDFNEDMLNEARRLQIDTQLSPIKEKDLQELKDLDCDILVVAKYANLIPDWRPYIKYAINFHPSPLPEARGPYPLVRAILESRNEWGITCHKLSERLDRGDILAREMFPLRPYESHEILDIKLQMASRRLASQITKNFDELWANAEPQGKGSYWKRWKEEERILDFSLPVEDILRRIRAFGHIRSIAVLGDTKLYVQHADGWKEGHEDTPGTVAHVNSRIITIAAADGYIALIKWSVLNVEAEWNMKRLHPT